MKYPPHAGTCPEETNCLHAEGLVLPLPIKERKIWHEKCLGISRGSAVATASGAELRCQTRELRDAVMHLAAIPFTEVHTWLDLKNSASG